METAKVEDPQSKRWKPKYNEIYWLVSNETIYEAHWFNDNGDKWRYLIGNCFETEEEAEEYKKKIKYTARYKNYIEEHSEPLDWNDTNQCKWFAELCYDSNKIAVECYYSYKSQGTIYASSKQIILDAIKEIGEDNFKKYVLGVK